MESASGKLVLRSFNFLSLCNDFHNFIILVIISYNVLN